MYALPESPFSGLALLSGEKPAPLPRRKIWETDVFFHCPLISVSLSTMEQRRLCRKAGVDVRAESDFIAHEHIISCLGAPNALSREVERLLTRKYEKNAADWMELPEKEFVARCGERFAAGEIGLPLWAASARRLSQERAAEVFGALHMAMHEHVRAHAKLKELAMQAEENFQRERRARRTLLKELRALAREDAALRLSLSRAQKELAARREQVSVTIAPERIPELLARVDELSERVRRAEEEQQASEKMADSLRCRLRCVKTERDQLKEELRFHLAFQEALAPSDQNLEETGEEARLDLRQKRVLIVGGLERMEVKYRRYLEERGGSLEYHAGNVRSGVRDLENAVRRADLIFCPVNCNSHGACLKLKALGKKYGKDVRMLANFSLSSLARTAEDLA